MADNENEETNVDDAGAEDGEEEEGTFSNVGGMFGGDKDKDEEDEVKEIGR